jgi:hypothetical protein
MGKAAYLLKNEHLQSGGEWMAAPGERRNLQHFDLAVCVPTLVLNDALAIAPDCTFAAYDDVTSIPHYGSAGSLYDRMRADLDWTILRGPGGEPIRNRYDNFEGVLSFDAADARAQWIASNVQPLGFDTFYIDNLWGGPPPDHWIASTGREAQETRRRWPHWRDYYVQRLRDALGPQTTILGNIGGSPRPGLIDAYTVEWGSSGRSPLGEIGRFVTNAHPFNVAWFWLDPWPERIARLDGYVLAGELIPGSV